MADANIQPTFEAEKVTGTFHRTLMVITEDSREVVGPSGAVKVLTTRKMTPEQQTFTDGYMIYYPQGHSILVAADDHDQLQRLGVMEAPKLVDMATGEEVPDGFNLSPKQIVAAKTRNPRRADVGAN